MWSRSNYRSFPGSNDYFQGPYTGIRLPTAFRGRRPNTNQSSSGFQRRVNRIQNHISGTQLQTKTATKTQFKHPRKKLYSKLDADGPMSDSYFKFPVHLPSFGLGKFKKLTAPQFYIYNQTQRLTAGIGLQGILGVASNGSLTTTPSAYAIADLSAIMALASNIVSSQIGNPKTQKVYMDKCDLELMMTNQTNDVCNVKIYDITARRDLPQSNYQVPALSWVTGTTTDMGSTTWNVVGSNPFQCPAFTNLYRVDKVIDVNLHAGAHHVHRSTIAPKAIFDDELIQENADGTGFKEWTKFQMVVIHGYAINDSSTVTQVSTAQCAVDFIWKKQYQFHVVERSNTQITYGDNLPGSFGVAGEFINDLTGAVVNTLVA